LSRSLAFHSRIGLASEIGGGTFGAGEEAGEQWLEEGAEDDLGAVGHGEGHPEDQDEFEDVIEGWLIVRLGCRGGDGETYGTSKQH
jgi:hypothetical protein